MATIIRRPQVGENPRRVVPDTKSDTTSSQDRAHAAGVRDTTTRDNSTLLTPIAEQRQAGQGDSDADSNQLAKNPLAEALKLANARSAKAEQRLEALQEEIEQQREKAAEEGYQEGHAKGLKQGADEYRKRIELLDEIIEQLTQRRGSLIAEAEDAAIELAFAAAGKILFGQLGKRETTAAIVRNLKQRLVGDTCQLTVHVSHDDLQLFTSSDDGRSELPDGIRLVGDDRVRYGGCIVENDSGNVDARLEVQLQELLELFARVRRQGREEDS